MVDLTESTSVPSNSVKKPRVTIGPSSSSTVDLVSDEEREGDNESVQNFPECFAGTFLHRHAISLAERSLILSSFDSH